MSYRARAAAAPFLAPRGAPARQLTITPKRETSPAGEVRNGSIAAKINHSGHFRLSLNSGSTEDIAVGPVRAKSCLWRKSCRLGCLSANQRPKNNLISSKNRCEACSFSRNRWFWPWNATNRAPGMPAASARPASIGATRSPRTCITSVFAIAFCRALGPLKGYASQTTVVYAETEGTCLNSTRNTPRAGRMKYVWGCPMSQLGYFWKPSPIYVAPTISRFVAREWPFAESEKAADSF